MSEEGDLMASISELIGKHGDHPLDAAIKPGRYGKFRIGCEGNVHQARPTNLSSRLSVFQDGTRPNCWKLGPSGTIKLLLPIT